MGHLVPTHVLALVVICCVVQACSLAYHHYTVVDITIKIILVTSVLFETEIAKKCLLRLGHEMMLRPRPMYRCT